MTDGGPTDSDPGTSTPDSPEVTGNNPQPEGGATDMRSILPGRRRADQLAYQMSEAHKRLGILHAVSVIKAPLIAGDVDGAIALCNELTRDALVLAAAPPVIDLPPLPAAAPPPRPPAHHRAPLPPLSLARRIVAWPVAALWRIGFAREFDHRDREV